jgi:hypothetical protein
MKLTDSFILIAATFLNIAASNSVVASAPRYKVEILDQPAEKRFLITLKSFDSRPLCLGVEQWPNVRGQVDTGSKRAKLESAKGTYLARDENFGSCLGDACIIHLAPRSSIRGFINYAEFGDPSVIATLPQRQLHFPVTTWICVTHAK